MTYGQQPPCASNFYIVALSPTRYSAKSELVSVLKKGSSGSGRARKIAQIIQGVRKCLNQDLDLV